MSQEYSNSKNQDRAYIIIPICFHFADQYKWPKLRSCLVSFSKKFLSIKGGGEKVLKYWSGSLDTVSFDKLNVIPEMGRVFVMLVALLHLKLGQYNYGEDAPHFTTHL